MKYRSLLTYAFLMLGCVFLCSSCAARVVKNSVTTYQPMYQAQWSDTNTYSIDETRGTKINNIGLGRQYNHQFHQGHYWGGGATFIKRLEKIPNKGVVSNLTMGGFASGGIRAGNISAQFTASGNQDEYTISATISLNIGMGVKTFFKRY